MSDSKMQGYVLDAFLEWMVDECDTRCESYTLCTERDRFGRFELVWVQTSWVAWQASREAVVIDLPPPCPVPDEPEEAIDDSHMDAYHAANGMRHACSKFIEAAGLKVKV